MTNNTLNSELSPERTGPIAYRASWVCPVDQPPIPNGVVVVENGLIQTVESFNSFTGALSSVRDWGNGAILPGLINAHTHLEFSDLEKPLGSPGIRFTDWIRLIVGCRNDTNAGASDKKRQAIQKGLNESIKCGVVAVGEIATMPFQVNDYLQTQIAVLFFLEQLGSNLDSLPDKHHELKNFLDTPTAPHPTFEFHASAHAPYSCHPDLIDQICEQAFSQNRMVAMHLAETRAERELLESQTGDFVELLKDFGVWNPSAFQSRSVLSILKKLSKGRSLVIHGNYLTQVELDFVAQQDQRMAIVYCPRTHQFFGHDEYPLEEMYKRRIRVAIGTDSRASNPDLNLFEELKLIARSFPNLPTEQVLQMGTLNGAAALGLEKHLGTLTPKKSAVINFVCGPAGDSHPYEWLFTQEDSNAERIY